MTFEEFGLNEDILQAIHYMGFTSATPVQERAIPAILEGRDIMAFAQTGTGKTAAFMLPIMHFLKENPQETTSTLVIVPTRELAVQIDQQIQGFAYFAGVSSIAVYGGGSGNEWEIQKKGMENHVDIIVATPGKLLSHLNMGNPLFKDLKFLILDEADRMLDMGFYDDIKKIISFLPKKRQTLMFSATMPHKIKDLAKQNLQNPLEISIAISKPSEGIDQQSYLVESGHKIGLINHIIKNNPTMNSIIVFSSTKRNIAEITRSLQQFGYAVEGISSDLEQKEREEVLNRFKSKQTKILVATDVLARGIDIKDIQLVVNFNVPHDAEDYVHRIGRTARAETKGIAITLVNSEEMYRLAMIERVLEKEIPKNLIPQNIGQSPEWNPKRSKTTFSNRIQGKNSKSPQYHKGSHNKNSNSSPKKNIKD
ncbi:MAG: DEAD/DEAH box helicase [Saprospiraceae bacterium]|nr:DEAD/DEAH box helicase [Saprospiraceae bacterium]MBK7523162.1 DEAD/DEAH box helicase [Saprospiraceae bacterium]MBK8371843.1 DEAD/DEAH box helicase [Saprospiraceae bacterium]MBK8547108.1 DEAD/DEAH box helicase [Saprospiraceae bacterium]MBK8853300.1 DEAD/DEAH box helicase [Saprospiraceae bacterium]